MAWKSTGFVETLDTFFSMAFINRTGATLLLTVLFLCLWHFPRRRVHSFRHPVNTVFAKFIVIGATLLSFIRSIMAVASATRFSALPADGAAARAPA